MIARNIDYSGIDAPYVQTHISYGKQEECRFNSKDCKPMADMSAGCPKKWVAVYISKAVELGQYKLKRLSSKSAVHAGVQKETKCRDCVLYSDAGAGKNEQIWKGDARYDEYGQQCVAPEDLIFNACSAAPAAWLTLDELLV